MSKLDELIKELCPDGVEYKELQDVLKIKNGRDYKSFGEGEYPVYGSGGIMTYINHFVYDKPSVLIPRKGSIDKLYYVNEPFWNVDTIFYTEIDTTLILPRYVYHCLLKEHLEKLNTAGGVPSLTQKVLNKVKIPVPPLEVQREIVRILDSFTLLTAELTAELTARRKQYDFYRDKLLTFGNDVNIVPLAEIADIGTGSSNTNEGLEEGKYPFFVRSQEPLRKNDYEYDETAIITAGDGVGVGKVFHYVEGKYALHQRAYRIHINVPDVLPRYYFHYMRAAFLPYIQKTMFQGSVASIRRPMLNQFPVPVPSLDVQQRLVNVLDNFESICSDLKIGLPAEIEARQRQYEFYRDALLTYAATGKIIAQTDRQTDKQTNKQTDKLNGLILLCQYVFGYILLPVSAIANIQRGKRVVRSQLSETVGYPVYQNSMTPLGYHDKANCNPNTAFVIVAGAAGEVGYSKEAFWAADDCYFFECSKIIKDRYLYYALKSQQDKLLSQVRKASVPRLSRTAIDNLEIILPCIEKQTQIVSILDRFEALCSDITTGIPAEIEARQKQYEYYRDKLLFFEEIQN